MFRKLQTSLVEFKEQANVLDADGITKQEMVRTEEF
jgi:hypothetical protein